MDIVFYRLQKALEKNLAINLVKKIIGTATKIEMDAAKTSSKRVF